MTASEIAAALGKARREGRGWRCCCPLHGGHSLVLGDGRDGRLLVRCWGGGCDPRDVLAELRRRGLIGTGSERPAAPSYAPQEMRVAVPRRTNDEARRIAAARRIWNGVREARGTPVAAYLASRSITLAPPLSLRFAPALRRLDGVRGPAMVAIVEHVDHGFVGVHRTWLAREPAKSRNTDTRMSSEVVPVWRRLGRASLGPISGAAVRLAPAGELLMVAEGIETAMSSMQATGAPAWAALSTSGLLGLVLPPLPFAAIVVILADNDANGAGERAAQSAAARWLAEARRVRIALPPIPGTDFNDMLLGNSDACVTERCDAAA